MTFTVVKSQLHMWTLEPKPNIS